MRDVDKDLEAMVAMRPSLEEAMHRICKEMGLLVHPWIVIERAFARWGTWAARGYYSPEDMSIHLASSAVVDTLAILAHEMAHHVVSVNRIKVPGDRYKHHGKAFSEAWVMVARACKRLGYPAPSWGLQRPTPAVE